MLDGFCGAIRLTLILIKYKIYEQMLNKYVMASDEIVSADFCATCITKQGNALKKALKIAL